jgi:hypothetical protein
MPNIKPLFLLSDRLFKRGSNKKVSKSAILLPQAKLNKFIPHLKEGDFFVNSVKVRYSASASKKIALTST